MVMRIGGLASGMDIDELVKKLMSAERMPLDKLFQKKTTYEWQRDAYRGVNTKLNAFETYVSNNLSLKSITSKTASSSNSNLVSAIATGKASGSLSIEGVSQLAEAGRITSDQLNATGSTKMSTIASGTINFTAVKADGTPGGKTPIEITADMTVDDFVKKVNESGAGVSAVFENGRFSFTAKNTGKEGLKIEGDLTKLTGGVSVGKGKNAIFQVNGIATERSSNSFSLNGYNVTLKDTFNSTQTIADKYKSAQTERDNAYASLETGVDGKDSLKEAARKAKEAYDDMKGDYENKFASVFGSSALDATEQEAYKKFNNKEFLSELSDNEISQLKDPNFDINLPENKELKEKVDALSPEQLEELSKLDEAQLTNLRTEANREIKQENYNKLEKSFLSNLTANEITAIQGIDFTKEDPYEGLTLTDELKAKLGELSSTQKAALDNLSSVDLTSFKELAVEQIPHDTMKAARDNAVAAEVAGQSRLDKAEETLIKAKADADAAGILKGDGSIDLDKVKDAPKVPPVTLTATTNVDDMMKTVKDFVETYNGLIKDLTNQSKESKYRDYKPLSDEQKKDMSESEIKLWEEKAKSGLLRNDALIRNGLADMRSLVYETNPGLSDSKFNSLFSVGITTTKNYNEGGILGIDEVKLRKVIEEDPDAIEKLFKNSDGKKSELAPKMGTGGKPELDGNGNPVMELADTRGYVDKLRDSLKSFEISIEKKAGRSTMTDAQYSIGKGLVDTEKRISTWQDKLKMIEARYWKQFGAMESAINKANSQSSMFMQG